MTTEGEAPPGDAWRIEVQAGAGRYPVLVGAGLLEGLPDLLRAHARADHYAIVSDDRVGALYGEAALARCRRAGLTADLFDFPHGEPSKVRETWARLTDALLEAGVGRDGCVVALGGGVTGDLAGFVAATYLRGVPLVQLPTSLVAMIDASVGGKVGVDTGAGKNLVGAFHAPRLVAADLATLETLEEPERAQGLVEALKHGAILDPAYFARVVEEAPGLLAAEPDALGPVVARSVELKAAVVTDDEREAGLRQILNFGHTVGHALEAASAYRLGHGAAVAAGMVVEARIGEAMGITDAGTAQRLETAVATLGYGLDVGPVDLEAVRGHLRVDKKAREGTPRYVLLHRIGEVDSEGGWSHAAPPELVDETLAAVWRA